MSAPEGLQGSPRSGLRAAAERRLAGSEFLRSVLALMAGGAAAQAIGIAVSPLLARLFTPADFGVLGLFLALAAILGEVGTLRYDLAVMLPDDDRDALATAALAGGLMLGTAAATLLGVAFLRREVAALVGEPALAPWLWLLPASILIAGGYSVLSMLAGRRKLFRDIARNRVGQAGVSAAASLGLGLARTGAGGLLAGTLAGQAAGPLLLFPRTWRAYAGSAAGVDRARVREVARRYRDFPRFELPNSLVFAVAQSGLVLLLGRFFGAEAVGLYAFAQKILMAPYLLFASAFSQAFYQKLSATWAAEPTALPGLVGKAIDRIVLVWTVPLALLAGLSFFYAPIVFGADWGALFRYVFLLAPPAYLTLVAVPLSHVLKTIGRQRTALALNTSLSVARIGALLLAGALGWGILDALLVFSVVGTLHVTFNLLVVLRRVGLRPSPVLVAALTLAVGAAAALVAWRWPLG